MLLREVVFLVIANVKAKARQPLRRNCIQEVSVSEKGLGRENPGKDLKVPWVYDPMKFIVELW